MFEVPKSAKSSQNAVCAKCLGPAKPDGKLMKCARCQRVYYCSKECQAAHWPLHKTMCKYLHISDQEIVDKCGPEFRRDLESWWRMNSPAFGMLVVGMLKTPDQRRNSVIVLVAEHKPGQNPPFQIQDLSTISMASLQNTDPMIYDAIMDHRNAVRDEPRSDMVGRVVLFVSNVDMTPRITHMVLQDNDFHLALPPATVKHIINTNPLEPSDWLPL